MAAFTPESNHVFVDKFSIAAVAAPVHSHRREEIPSLVGAQARRGTFLDTNPTDITFTKIIRIPQKPIQVVRQKCPPK
jgi:hypothetical protein